MGRARLAGKPTLREVADRAGVSIATASRAMTGRGQVSAATAVAVSRAAKQLGYAVDDVRARRRERRLAVIVGSLSGLFVDQIVEAVEAVNGAGTTGCVVATTGDDPVRELTQLRSLLEDPTVSAVVVAGGRWSSAGYVQDLAALVREYAVADKPLVFCGRPAVDAGSPGLVVNYDNVGGAAAAMSYLLSHGHRDVLFVRGPLGFSTSDARARGFEQACAEFGVEVNPALVRIGSRDRRTGVEAVRAALQDGPAFTAVFGECDLIALGALAALEDAGIAVPEQMSVIGFDDMLLSADLRVPLTTVHVPFGDVGYTAARMALQPDRANREGKLVAGTHLVIRKSVLPRSATPGGAAVALPVERPR
ncbi:LacI family DNA-binding transcriptional regulator [Micromonospora sp. NPDC002717]|uniref:LacI family DNA-binding transcriptional regulator n=1 Tax=Micromonospora sp. NPDC002717 TaxID=3154424 RepID=UPI0033293463